MYHEWIFLFCYKVYQRIKDLDGVFDDNSGNDEIDTETDSDVRTETFQQDDLGQDLDGSFDDEEAP